MSQAACPAIAAVVIFVATYVLLATERIPRTIAALAGAVAVLLLRLVPQDKAFSGFAGVDWNVIFLLLGMMIVVTVTRRTGLFEWLAIRGVKLTKGRPILVTVWLAVLTACLSACLDNVTAVLFMAPIALFVAEAIGISPVPLLITQIFASNIGGTATLIGDPPNIMIGSAAHLGFVSFLTNLAPLSAIAFVVSMGASLFAFRKQLAGPVDLSSRVASLDESRALRDLPMLRRCLAVLAVTFLGFLLHEVLHLRPATVALAGAVLILLLTRVSLTEVLREVEWSTLLFFVGLFVLVSALVETGVIRQMAALLVERAEQAPASTAIGLLWLSAAASGVVDNIPLVAAINPMLVDLAAKLGGPGLTGTAALHTPGMMALWWSLAAGACLGGNATLIGASANVVIVDLAKRDGHPISFLYYLRYGLLATGLSMVVATVYIWARYL